MISMIVLMKKQISPNVLEAFSSLVLDNFHIYDGGDQADCRYQLTFLSHFQLLSLL